MSKEEKGEGVNVNQGKIETFSRWRRGGGAPVMLIYVLAFKQIIICQPAQTSYSEHLFRGTPPSGVPVLS